MEVPVRATFGNYGVWGQRDDSRDFVEPLKIAGFAYMRGRGKDRKPNRIADKETYQKA